MPAASSLRFCMQGVSRPAGTLAQPGVQKLRHQLPKSGAAVCGYQDVKNSATLLDSSQPPNMGQCCGEAHRLRDHHHSLLGARAHVAGNIAGSRALPERLRPAAASGNPQTMAGKAEEVAMTFDDPISLIVIIAL